MVIYGLVLAGDPSWSSIALLGFLAALLAMDDTALAQTWFGQPLVAGILAGLFCGDAVTGVAIALPLQLLLIGNLPVGQTFTGEHSSAVVAAVGATVLAGHHLLPISGPLNWNSAALLGWMILATGLLGAVGHWIIQAERRAHVLWMQEGHRTLRDGDLNRVEALHGRCLSATLLRGFVLGILYLLVLIRFWLPMFNVLPEPALQALGVLPFLIAGLGLGALIEQYGIRACWSWVTGGAVCGALLLWLAGGAG